MLTVIISYIAPPCVLPYRNEIIIAYYLFIVLIISQTGWAQQSDKSGTDSLLLADSLFHTEDKATLDRCEKIYDYY